MLGLTGDLAAALALAAEAPRVLGGVWLRGEFDEEGVWASLPPERRRRLPAGIDEERLTGGLDVAATLGAGRPVRFAGLFEAHPDAIFVIAGAERLSPAKAGRIAAALDRDGPMLVLLDRSAAEEEAPPACLTERLAFHLFADSAGEDADDPMPLEDEAFRAIAAAACALGVGSIRADLFALRAAEGHARLRGAEAIDAHALSFALRTVLAPRATRLPAPAEPPPPPEPPEADDAPPAPSSAESIENLVVEAVRAALPADLLAALAERAASPRRAPAGAGAPSAQPLRGRVIGSRRGKPGGGARLAILDTLRAAAPWQKLRGRTDRVRIGPDDLRLRRHQGRSASLTILAVDASGSAAAQRLAEAKGAAEALLRQSYVRRAEVAVIAIRGQAASLLLPPTRSLTRARRLLAELPGGGGTPLAAGIEAARELAVAAGARGRTPSVVLLTDGRANIALDGSAGRERALADSEGAARRLASTGVGALVIDIGARARGDAATLARHMNGRYLHLPLADGAAVGAAAAAALEG